MKQNGGAVERSLLFSRCIAKSIDLFLIFLLSLILPHPAGVLLGLIYILVHDGLPGGQSIGKRLMRFKVLRYKEDTKVTEGPCTYLRSAIRNAPLGVPTFFAIIPFWGWFLSIIMGIPMVFVEVYLMFRRENNQRLGDVMADTVVVSVQK